MIVVKRSIEIQNYTNFYSIYCVRWNLQNGEPRFVLKSLESI
jgi:hypothetical protein